MSEFVFQLIYAAALGAIVGSFLNVVILRLPKKMMWNWRKDATEFLTQDAEQNKRPISLAALDDEAPPGLVVERSACPHCGYQLKWFDNIPVLSFVFLKGACRSCKTKISWQYPLVEIAMAALAVLAVVTWGWTTQGLMGGAFFAVLLAVSGIDFKTQLIPDEISLPALWAALLWAVCPLSVMTAEQAVLGAAIGYLSLWSVFWLFKLLTGKEGMGYGDFKLLALIGAFLGAPHLIWVILIGAVSGSVVGTILLRKHGASQPFAFGPYLALGAVLVVALGGHLPSLV